MKTSLFSCFGLFLALGTLAAAQGTKQKPPTAAEVQLARYKVATISNIKQIDIGLIMWSSDHDDVFPYITKSAQVSKLVLPYTKNEKLFKTYNPNGGQFEMNMSLAGVKATDIKDPANTILLYDSKAWPGNMHCVAYADGHGKFVTEEVWKKIAGSLKLKLPKHGKPIKS